MIDKGKQGCEVATMASTFEPSKLGHNLLPSVQCQMLVSDALLAGMTAWLT